MRFGEELQDIVIPEWKDCYLSYQTLKIFVEIMQAIVELIQQCEENVIAVAIVQSHSPGPEAEKREDEALLTLKKDLVKQLGIINRAFYHYFCMQMEIFELFYLMKTIQIQKREIIISELARNASAAGKRPLYLFYIEYAYIQVSYLSEMREANQEAQRKILKKHKKYAKNMVPTPRCDTEKIDRIQHIEKEYLDKIQNIYVGQYEEEEQKEAREYLRQVASKMEATGYEYFRLGLWMGTSIVILSIMIFIIVYQGLSVENDSEFARDFPVWRGIAIFIIYIWVLGFNIYCFETYKISHRLIFKFNDHLYSNYRYIFRLAGFFTTIFLVMFLLYLLSLTSLIHTFLPLYYFPLLPYVLLGGYLFIPLPIFNYRGRLYMLKLVLKCFLAVFRGVDFPIIWMTDQWISMITPLRDLSYTVCFYTKIDFSKIQANPCKISSTFQVAFLVIVIAFSCRLLLALRLGYEEGFFCTRHILNTFKVLSALLSSILAFFYPQHPHLLIFWIVFSSVSTIYSHILDLKLDWDLLQPDTQHCLLRKYLTFLPKRNYYVIIILNLLLRLSWAITLSPAIASLFGNANLVTFATGSAEIIRRGIWNLLRVQKEHLKNCIEFRAVPDLRELQGQLREDGEPIFTVLNIRNKEHNSNSQVVNQQFVELLKQKIKDRQIQQQEIAQQFQKKHQGLVKKARQMIREILKKNKKIQ